LAGSEKEIDVVLIDVHFGCCMGGIEISRQMILEKSNLKLIFTSGHPPTHFNNSTLSLGKDFLQKPFAPDELREIVARQLR
jgi:FixJ family two-component response regulator